MTTIWDVVVLPKTNRRFASHANGIAFSASHLN
jgi:hypothetical protein